MSQQKHYFNPSLNSNPQPYTEIVSEFRTLVEIVSILRGPKGCPWDKEQTSLSLTPYIIEEAFELVEVIETNNQKGVIEELGDFLLQVILQSQISKDEGGFDLTQVLKNLNEKLIRRHPHVFGSDSSLEERPLSSAFASDPASTSASASASTSASASDPIPTPTSSLPVIHQPPTVLQLPNATPPPSHQLTSQEVLSQWDIIKKKEKENQPHPLIDNLFTYPQTLPALQRSGKIGQQSKRLHFDWSTPGEVFLKVQEELAETQEALDPFDPTALEHEIGDLLFSVAQLARHCGFEPETLLRIANRRFENRFMKMHQMSGLSLEEFKTLPLEQKEVLWGKIKKLNSEL